MKELLPASAIRDRFCIAITEKFARDVADFAALQALVAANGGRFHNDHGAIRTADPELCRLFVRAAQVLGLRRELDYQFPAKKLVSFDLQVIGEDHEAFKIFVSQVDLDAFPPEVADLIREDCALQAAAVDHQPLLSLIERFEATGGLTATDAEAFVDRLVNQLMRRNGPPISRSTLDAVARVSGEAASALALGPDFNHITIDTRAAGFSGVDDMARAMAAAGFQLLPQIQGAPGSKLRQTATMAATMATPVLEADGSTGSARTEKQFVEIIERNQAVDAAGHKLWRQDGQPLIFRNFLASNAERIFDAASTKPGAAQTC